MRWRGVVAVVLVAVNLRPAVASVGPVLADIRSDLGLSGLWAALLTATPVLCFGLLAASAPALARRWGIEAVITGVLLLLTCALLVRVTAGPVLLFAGTLLAAGAIAVANVLIPTIIKRDHAERAGIMVGIYTMALSGAAAAAAGTTVPFTDALGRGWRGGLAIWAGLAGVALVAWVLLARRPRAASGAASSRPAGSLWRDRLAWEITCFFGLQSLSFYAVLSWLPSIYRDHGYSPARAGLLLSVSTLIQIPVSLTLPSLASRTADQRWLIVACALVTGTGFAGVLLAPTAAPFVWAIVIGIGQGGSFALGLLLFSVRSPDTATTARLSAQAQTVGYVLAAGGPLVLGAVHDLTGSWSTALGVLLMLLLPQIWFSLRAGAARFVGANSHLDVDEPATVSNARQRAD